LQKDDQYEKIQLEVLQRIRPKQQERDRLTKKYEEITKRIKQILAKANITAKVVLTGSFSRDTWLSGNRDIDIFVIMPYSSDIILEDLLQVIRKGIKYDWIKKHAKHPYLYAVTDEIIIEILPCYEFKQTRDLRSAVDRSPSHSTYINENLPIGANEEVRLLKQFMHGIGVYGAEIKVHGFSGYLVELLIIYYGGKFIEVLKYADELPGKIISLKETIARKKKKFEDDLVLVIDPIDNNRNVASALKESALYNFIAAAKKYLKEPSKAFFFPETLTINKKKMAEMLDHPLHYLAILHEEQKISDDILWGQLRRFERSIRTYLTMEAMNPIFVDSIITKNEIMTVIVSTEEFTRANKWLKGPPVTLEATDEFLNKHKTNPEVVFGPAIIEGNWRVLVKRPKLTLSETLQLGLKNGAISQPSHLNIKNTEILSREALVKRIENDEDKLRFLYSLLKGKPRYL